MSVFLAITPQELPQLTDCPLPLVYMAYRVDDGGLLSRSAALPALRGGLMGLCDRCRRTLSQQDRLLRAIVRECSERKFGGVFADLEGTPNGERVLFYDKLGAALSAQGKRLYVPQSCPVPNATLLVGTAVSGGSLKDLLQEQKVLCGGRIALDLERIRMDFTLPCPTGRGKMLTQVEFSALKKTYGMAIFFSRELCAHYFTYTKEKEGHFVLFDDAQTLRSKIELGKTFGIETGFLMYPEVKDILTELYA